MPKHDSKDKIASPALKFLIGFTAGLCAVFFPRLMAALAVAGKTENIVLFNRGYLIIALLFSAIIGVIVMIFEWRSPRRPQDTFMRALGIPALLAGAFNTTAGLDTLRDAVQENNKLTRELSREADIPILPSEQVTPLPGEGAPQSGSGSSGFGLPGLSTAYAEDRPREQRAMEQRYDPYFRVQQPLYHVVLDRAATEREAREKAARLRRAVPDVAVVQSGRSFLVVLGGGPRPKSDAVIEAVRLKKEKRLNPSLMGVK